MEKLLNRVKNMILSPRSEWQAVQAEQTTAKGIIFSYVAILAAVATVASILGLGIFGIHIMGKTVRYAFGGLLVFGLVQYVLTIVGVVVAGAVINALAPSFDSKQDSVHALKVAAYSLTPWFVASILNIIPDLRVIVDLASLYGIYLIYLGLGPLMATPENKTIGYTVVSIIVMVVVLILVYVIAGGIGALLLLSGLPSS